MATPKAPAARAALAQPRAVAGWWRRLFGRLLGGDAPAVVPAKVPARPVPATPKPVPKSARLPTPTDAPQAVDGKPPARAEVPSAADGIAGLAGFVGLELKPRPAPSDDDLVTIDRLAGMVMAHFGAHRPGPNSFPSLSLRVLNVIADPDEVDVRELVRLVSQDPALAASVLRVANSAAFRPASPIENVRDAVTRIGMREVASIAGALAARTLFNPEVRAEFATFRSRWSTLFVDSASVAMGTAWLSMQTGKGRSDRAFLAGLLHDVGKSIALKSVAALQHSGELDGALSDDLLDRLLEQVHVEIGGEVHQQWGLPDALTVICVRHHDQALPVDPELAELHLVRVVSGVRQLRNAPAIAETLPGEIEQSVKALGLDAYQFRALDTQLSEFAERTATAVGDNNGR